jgi:Na+-transporting methylmalonyl-CoA/oxaloacetate decarboxylase gamma subunit
MDKMYLAQGIEITIIGVSVVFAGLILTFFMINLFSTIPRVVNFLRKRKDKNNEEKSVVPSVDICDDHLAVLVMVLDIELKMRSLFDKGRFTFK